MLKSLSIYAACFKLGLSIINSVMRSDKWMIEHPILYRKPVVISIWFFFTFINFGRVSGTLSNIESLLELYKFVSFISISEVSYFSSYYIFGIVKFKIF